MARSLVGVTVHDNVLRGMEIARDQPRRWGEVPLDAGVIDQGAVVDVAAFADALEALWKSAGFSSKRMALAIEAEAATIRRVSLPGSVAEDIAEAAAYDIAEVLAYPAAEAVIDHAVLNAVSDQPLVETDGLLVEAPSIETLVVAVRRETIEGFTRAAKIAGLRWVRAELTPAANVSLLPKDPLGPSLGAVVSIGESTTTVSVHDGGGLLFARVLMTGVGDTASLSHELESQLAEVEHLRTGGQGVHGAEARRSDDAPGVAVVAEGIRRTLHFHATEIDKRTIDHVVLCGARSRAAGLLDRVAEAMPNASVALLEHGDWPTFEQSERFDTAFAVARLVQTSHSDHLRDLSLVPPSVRVRRQDQRAIAVGSAVAAVLAAAAFANFQSRSAAIDQQELTVEAAEHAVDRVSDEVDRFGNDRLLAAEIERRRHVVEALAADRVAVPALVGQLAEAMPADSILRSLQITAVVDEEGDASVVAIDGAAPDLDGVAAWIDGVNDSGVLSDVRLVSTSFGPYGLDEEDVAVFQVTATVAGTAIAPLPVAVTGGAE